MLMTQMPLSKIILVATLATLVELPVALKRSLCLTVPASLAWAITVPDQPNRVQLKISL